MLTSIEFGVSVENFMKNLKIATRNSTLALWQANHVKSLLLAEHKNLKCEIVPFNTGR